MREKKTFRSNKRYSKEELRKIELEASKYVEQIYEYFNCPIQYNNGTLIKSCCLIHGGDNPTALNFYYNGDYMNHYKCRTHGCEEHFGKSIFSLVRGGLSRFKYGWETDGDREASFIEAVDFLIKISNADLSNLPEVSKDYSDKKRFSTLCHFFHHNVQKPISTKEQYRSTIDEIPSEYFIARGYSKDILDRYDIGTCKKRGKFFNNRATVPIYSEDCESIIGMSGRSIFSECQKCNNYHDPTQECRHYPKWLHNKGFSRQNFLYNYWSAAPYIQSSSVAVLVESPGNVWRLEEAGVRNSLALLGTSLCTPQKMILDGSGALSVIIIMDNDTHSAGSEAAMKIQEQLSRLYNTKIIEIKGYNDIGDMSIQEVKNSIVPKIQEMELKYLR